MDDTVSRRKMKIRFQVEKQWSVLKRLSLNAYIQHYVKKTKLVWPKKKAKNLNNISTTYGTW